MIPCARERSLWELSALLLFYNVLFIFFLSSYLRMTVKKLKRLFIKPGAIINQHNSARLNYPPTDYKPSCTLLLRPNVVHPQIRSLLLQKSVVQNNGFHSDIVVSVLYHFGIISTSHSPSYATPSCPDLLSPPLTFMPLFSKTRFWKLAVFIFLVYLISLNMMIPNFIHFFWGGECDFILLYGWITLSCVYTLLLFIRLDEHPGWGHNLAIVSSIVMNRTMQMSLQLTDVDCFMYQSRSGIAGLHGSSIFGFGGASIVVSYCLL